MNAFRKAERLKPLTENRVLSCSDLPGKDDPAALKM